MTRRRKEQLRRWAVYALTLVVLRRRRVQRRLGEARRRRSSTREIFADLFPEIITVAAKNTIILAVLGLHRRPAARPAAGADAAVLDQALPLGGAGLHRALPRHPRAADADPDRLRAAHRARRPHQGAAAVPRQLRHARGRPRPSSPAPTSPRPSAAASRRCPRARWKPPARSA